MLTKIKNFLALNDEEYEEYEEVIEEPQSREERFDVKKAQKNNIVSLTSVQNVATKVVLHEPRSYSEAQEIADHLKNRRSVIINLQRMQSDQARRIVDFLSGTVYALGGDIQKLGVQTFLCVPDNVDLSGSITEYVGAEDSHGSRW